MYYWLTYYKNSFVSIALRTTFKNIYNNYTILYFVRGYLNVAGLNVGKTKFKMPNNNFCVHLILFLLAQLKWKIDSAVER